MSTDDSHKRGDSFERLVTIPPEWPNGHFVDWVVASQVRDGNGKLLADLTCEWVDPLTTRELRISVVSTTTWPVGITAELDVQFTRNSDGWVQSTETHSFTIIRDATQ